MFRFLRTGRRNQVSFKIVVVDKRKSSTGGHPLEEVGFYNPVTKEKKLNAERIKYWLSVGVQPSPTVHNLFVSEKLLEGKKIPVHKKTKKTEEKPKEATVAVPEVKAVPAEEPKPVPEPKPPEPEKEKPVSEAPKEELKKATFEEVKK